MSYYWLATFELLLVLVAPLLILYFRGGWPLRTIVPCLLTIPLIWYFTYAPLHELSHAAGTYLVGGKVDHYKLIPRFWAGEFGRAWITPSGITQSWQQLLMTAAPYMLDIACIVTGTFVLRRSFSKNAFIVGLVFMLLCLRPAFDFVCESIALAAGDRGDFYVLKQLLGSVATWSFIVCSLALCVYSISTILRRFGRSEETPPILGSA